MSAENAYRLNMVVLPTGQILLADEGGIFRIYTEDGGTSPLDAWRPVITGVQDNGGGNFTLTGLQLNGINEGATYGDDNESASNYPIIRFEDAANKIYYGRTFNWSSTGVATGSTLVTTNFTLPAGKNLTDFTSITVVANGIASKDSQLVVLDATHESVTIRVKAGDSSKVEVVDAANNVIATFDNNSAAPITVVGDGNNNTVTVDESNGVVNTPIDFDGGGDTGGAGDMMNVIGTGGSDVLNLSGAGGDRANMTFNGSAPYSFDNIEQFSFDGSGGNDDLTVNSSTALIGLLHGIHYGGGGGHDSLHLTQTGGPIQTSDTYSVGPNVGDGTSTIVGPGGTQNVFFQGLEPVVDTVPAAILTVNGTAADNAINYTQGSVAANGLITIDNFESIEFSNKTALTIDAGAGSDAINLHRNSNSNPTGLTGAITVIGGDPTASDTLTLNGISGTLDNLRYLPTDFGAGTVVNDNAPQPNVNFTGIEHLQVVVQQADGDGVRADGTTGNDHIEFTSGATSGNGTFSGTMDTNNATGVGPFAMTPMTFFNTEPIGNDTDVNFFNPGGTDTFVFNGTAADDTIQVAGGEAGGAEFRNTINGEAFNRLEVFNVASAIVRGLGGNDTFTQIAQIIPTVAYEGDDSDVLNYIANTASATTLDLGASTIAQATPTSGTVTYGNVGTVHLTASGAATLTVTGTAGNDTLDVTPTAAGAGSFALAGDPTDFTYTGFGGTFTVNGGSGGADTLGIVGSSLSDVVTLTATTMAANGGTVTIGAGIESLDVSTLGGNDTLTVDVTGGMVAQPLTFDGGIGLDQLNVIGTPPGGTGLDEVIYSPGPTPGAGHLRYENAANAALMTIDFLELEPVVDLLAAPILTVNGTAADNAINYTQGSTAARGLVTVDDFESIEFSNKTSLVINAGAGSDAINLNDATTPTGLTGGITVAGGDPTASDTLTLNGLAGQLDNLRYTPTDFGAGNVINDSAPQPQVNFTGIEHLQLVLQQTDGDSVRVEGTAGNDNIEYTQGANANSGIFSGTLDTSNATGVGPFAMTAVTYFNVDPLANDTDVGFNSAGGTDTLVFNGTAGSDTIAVGLGEAGGTEFRNTLNGQVVARIEAFNFASGIVNALGGDDVINVTSAALLTGGLTVVGGEPSAGSDTLNLNTTVGSPNATVNFNTNQVTGVLTGPITLDGVEDLNVNGTDGVANNFGIVGLGAVTDVVALTFNGGDTNNNDSDQIDVNLAVGGGDVDFAATSVSAASLQAETGPVVNITGFNNSLQALQLNGLNGSYNATVHGSAFADLLTASVVAATDNVSQSVGGNTWVQLDLVSFHSLTILGHEGDDTLTVDETGGFLDFPSNTTFDGGSGDDSLVMLNSAGPNAQGPINSVYNVGPDAGAGSIDHTHAGGGATETVYFSNLEPVTDLVAGTLTVNATNANNAINYGVGSAATNGLVSVDGFETVEFSNKTNLTIDALAGDDTINLNNVNTPTGLTGITVNGGDPTGSDTVIVNGTAGADTIIYTPTGSDAGTVLVNALPLVTIATAEQVTINGLGGGDALTVTATAGSDDIVYTPGATADSGAVTVNSLIPLSFQNLGAVGSLAFADQGGIDRLIYNGTGGNDNFSVNVTGPGVIGFQSDVASVIGGTTHIQVSVPAAGNTIEGLLLNGLDGDDNFIINASTLFSLGIAVNGGNPSGSDRVTLNGTAGADALALTVGAANDSVTGLVGGPVNLSSVEDLVVNTAAGTDSLTVNNLGGQSDLQTVQFFSGGDATDTFVANGTLGADNFNVTPLFAGSASVSANGLGPVVTANLSAAASSTFTVDAFGGSDSVSVNATQTGETIDVTAALVTVAGLKPVNYANTENLRIISQAGSDTINVTPSATTTIFVDGGDPIGTTPGDLLNLFPPAAFVLEAGPEIDEGGLRGLLMQRVSWDHIEGITISGPGPAKVVGTNGDDDITVIARDSSTHAGTDGVQDFTVSVNGGVPVLFLNQPTLLIDALAGDDDIVVRAPAPNNAVWNVALTVAGGTPAAATGDQGDVLEYETPGQQTITYTPGTIPGTGVINDTTLATTITIAQFLCPVDNLPSSPGSIEQLILDGEGGNDNVTVIGTGSADTIVQTPGNLVDSGSIAVNNQLGLTYEDLGAGATLAIDGAGGSDTLVVDGTSNTDVFGVLANGNVTLAGHLTVTRTNYENVTLRGQDGDDVFNVNGGSTLTSIQIEGGDPSASDVLNYTATANAGTVVDLGAATISQTGPAGPTVGLNGVERVNLTSSGGASTLAVTGTAGDDTINVTPTAAGVGSFVRLGLGGSPQFTYTGVGGTFTVDGGSGGFDTLGILGDDAADTVTSTATSVTIKGGTVTLGAGLDYLNISTFGGNDNVTLTGLSIAKTVDAGAGNDNVNLSAAVDATILGGDGDDILVGSPAADIIFGGTGNDILIGGGGIDEEYGEAGNDQFGDLSLTGNGVADDAGNDFLFGGDGADTFIWEPGDGSDADQGGDDAGDVLRFLGSAAANAFLLSANSTDPSHFNLNLGAATVDTSGVEQVILSALAGADTVTVNDLTTTEIKAVNIDLGAGDADSATINGRNTGDDVQVSSGAAGLIDFQGLGYDLNLSNATTTDTLTVNGNNGDDSIKANAGVETTIAIVLNGNDGNDYLSADATLNGGNGDDTLVGGVGADTLNGDAGNDILTGNGGADTINGGAGTDTIVETRDANFTLTNTALTIGAEGTDTLSSIERAELSGGLGANTFNIGAFTGKITLFGDAGSDTVDFSAATAAINIDMDVVDEDQVVDLAGTTLVFADIMENLVATDFNDTIKIDIAPFNRFVDGGVETSIPPGDRLYVDMLGSNPSSTKIPNGKPGSFDGTVNGAGVLGTITYVDIETLAIQNPNGGGGPNGGIPIDFGAATDYPVGNGPRGVVAADVNGDGILDMIVANRNSSSVSVRFGNGFGGFLPEHVYNSGTNKKDNKRSITVALGDVDNDGDLDIAVTNRIANTVGVLLNNGAGVFTTTTFSTGVGKLGKFPTSVKLGDMNNDGNLDIVTTNASVGKKNGSIAILLGSGTGSFGTANTIMTQGRKPRDLVLGDFNGDGNLDVAATNLLSREIVFMAGNGGGGLAAPVSYTVGSQPTSIIAADFNGDGILDLAVTCQTVREISVLMGTGLPVGTFSETIGIKYPNTELEISINSADLNGDGNADLIIANRVTNTLSYMLGLGNGTFDTRVDFKVGGVKGREPVAIAYGDFNNDGAIDLMVANAGTDDVSVLLRNPIV